MLAIKDYIATIEGTCGSEKDVVVTFKNDKKDEIISRILRKTDVQMNLSGIIFDLRFKDTNFRLYSSGKAIFRRIRNREELNDLLESLLL